MKSTKEKKNVVRTDDSLNQFFAPLELYFINYDKKEMYRFAITDNLFGLLDLLQYVADSSTSGLESVAIRCTVRKRSFVAAKLAEHYNIRKRSFDERMKNIRTWTLPAADKATI